MRTFFLLLALCVCTAATQDPAAVNPKIVKVEFENDQVRILRVHYEPHERLEMHSQPAKAEVQLTAGSVRLFLPDGKSSDEPGSAGEFFWLEPTKHATENPENTPLEFIEIEMKKAVAPSVPAASAVRGARPEPVSVEDEPHHHWKFENQYVRVLEEVLAPAESTLVHTHSHDGIGVYLSSGSLQAQELGKQWGPPKRVRQGQISPPWGGSVKLPLTHRVKNAGTTELHLIFIELLQ